MSTDGAYIAGTVPTGVEFAAAMSPGIIAVRVRQEMCVVHPRWMDREQVERLRAALDEVLTRWEDTRC